MIIHVDDYYWMRLRMSKNQQRNMTFKHRGLLIINLENIYKEQSLAHTNKLQDKLFNEMVARIKRTIIPHLI